jgi:DNA polymerase
MLVGEGPGQEEDLQGEPFVGRSGKLLDRLLEEELGIPRSSCYITNVVKCRPPNNRDPLLDEIECCRPFLQAQIDIIKPKVIMTLGNFATKTLLGTKTGITALRGRVYDFRQPRGSNTAHTHLAEVSSISLVPTYHPSAALRAGGGVILAAMRADMIRAKEQYRNSRDA